MTSQEINDVVRAFNRLHETSGGSNNCGDMWVEESVMDELSNLLEALHVKYSRGVRP